MSTRFVTLAGLLAGILAALVLAAALVAFVPDAPLPTTSPEASSGPAETQLPMPPPTVAAPPTPTAEPAATTTAFHLGQPAPRLVVPQLGGGTIDLATLRGSPVWVYFMATWCPQCRDEIPLMNRFARDHAEDGLVILAIDVREEDATVAAFANLMQPAFPMGLDRDGAMQDGWDVYFLPIHFWVDAEGIVREGALGGIGPDLMTEALGLILPDGPASP